MYGDDGYVGVIVVAQLSSLLAIATKKIFSLDYFCMGDVYIKGGHVYLYARSVRSKNIHHVAIKT